GLFGKLGFEAINRGGLFAEFRKLARVLGPELLYDEFEPARHDCKIGTRLIFVGLDFHHRWRNVSFDPAQRQSDRAGMDRRNGGESEQARGEKAKPDIHGRLDQGEHGVRLRPRTPTPTGQRCHAKRLSSSLSNVPASAMLPQLLWRSRPSADCRVTRVAS